MALVVKNMPANAEDVRDMDSIPGLGRSPEGGNGNSGQYYCLKNPIDRAAWHAMVQRVKRLSKVIKEKMEQIDELVSKMF